MRLISLFLVEVLDRKLVAPSERFAVDEVRWLSVAVADVKVSPQGPEFLFDHVSLVRSGNDAISAGSPTMRTNRAMILAPPATPKREP